MKNIQIIIARYNEKLSWLQEAPFNEFQYIVYNKGDNDDFEKLNVIQVINLPNVGKCDHTYLYHIVHNFENLSDIIVFFPGSIDSGHKKNKAIEILNRIKNNNYEKAVVVAEHSRNILREFYNFTMDQYSTSYSQNYTKNNESNLFPAESRPFGKWYLHNFGNINVQYYLFHGIFSVDKNDVIAYPLYRYEKLLNQLDVHSNPEVGHYIERSWGAIFYPMSNTRVLVNNIKPNFRIIPGLIKKRKILSLYKKKINNRINFLRSKFRT